jgi:hypothetical protein
MMGAAQDSLVRILQKRFLDFIGKVHTKENIGSDMFLFSLCKERSNVMTRRCWVVLSPAT